MAAKIIEKPEKPFDETVAKGVWLAEFRAEWCGPCKLMASAIEAHVAPKAPEGTGILMVDVDEHPELAVRYGILSVPAMLVFRDGELVKQMAGAQMPETVLQAIEEAANR